MLHCHPTRQLDLSLVHTPRGGGGKEYVALIHELVRSQKDHNHRLAHPHPFPELFPLSIVDRCTIDCTCLQKSMFCAELEWPWVLLRNAMSKIRMYLQDLSGSLDGVVVRNDPLPEASWSISIRFRRRTRAVYITLRIGSGNWLLQIHTHIHTPPYRVLTFSSCKS